MYVKRLERFRNYTAVFSWRCSELSFKFIEIAPFLNIFCVTDTLNSVMKWYYTEI